MLISYANIIYESAGAHMRRFLSGSIIAAFLSVPATAADMPVKAPVRAPAPVVAAYNWTGFYIGGHGGGAWGEKCFTEFTPAAVNRGCHDVDGWLGGGQIGVNWQTGNIVFGVEFSGSAADIDGTHVVPNNDAIPDTLHTKINSIFLLTGRVGLAWNQLLAYVTGGGAWVRENYTFADGGGPTLHARETRGGWTIGAGVEYALSQNWSLAAQYNFVELGDRNRTLAAPGETPLDYRMDQHLHLATVRLNYRFGGAGPVAARY